MYLFNLFSAQHCYLTLLKIVNRETKRVKKSGGEGKGDKIDEGNFRVMYYVKNFVAIHYTHYEECSELENSNFWVEKRENVRMDVV